MPGIDRHTRNRNWTLNSTGLPIVTDQLVLRTVGRIELTTVRAIAVHTMAAVATNSIEVTTRGRAATSATTTAAVPVRAASIARRAAVQPQGAAVASYSTSTDCWIWQSGIVTRVVPSCRMAVTSASVHGLLSHTFVIVGDTINRGCVALRRRRELAFYGDNTIVALAFAVCLVAVSKNQVVAGSLRQV